MCLISVFSTKAREKILKAKIGENGLKVYKVVRVGEDNYYSPFMVGDYREGENEARQQILGFGKFSYISGFHFYKEKYAAEKTYNALSNGCPRGSYKIIECIVKKEWITEIGSEVDIFDYVEDIVIVAKKAIFPKHSKEN